MRIDLNKCTGCTICEEVCPLGVISIEDRKVRVSEGCVECKTCTKVCPEGVFSFEEPNANPVCTACPIMCRIPESGHGACMRYSNKRGEITRQGRVHTFEEVEALVRLSDERLIDRPLLTGIGAGTTYPDFRPSPFIVTALRDGVDVVTVVTEAPLSYSGMKIKVDTDLRLGDEAKRLYVRRKGKRHIGHLCTEEYGSKMLSLGGVNILTSRDGLFAAKVMAEFLRGKTVRVEVEDGSVVELALGRPPVVNGEAVERMRVGCGSATTGLFAPYMFDAADEVVVLDGHITGLFSEHPSGRYLGKARSPLAVVGRKSTDGRYFLNRGAGWGGTDVEHPLDAVTVVEAEGVREGTTLLVTETTGQRFAFFRFGDGRFRECPPGAPAVRFIEVLRASCEQSRVSAVFAAGVGGSARAGVTKNPIRLTKAVHEGRVSVTVGGAKPFIFPGGGINFLVDVEHIKLGSIYLTPTPSFVLPIEYTMTRQIFQDIGGHMDAVRPVGEVLREQVERSED
jgi:NAD-dependent dihydropyrimidine dehydrogenase PreA subunit